MKKIKRPRSCQRLPRAHVLLLHQARFYESFDNVLAHVIARSLPPHFEPPFPHAHHQPGTAGKLGLRRRSASASGRSDRLAGPPGIIPGRFIAYFPFLEDNTLFKICLCSFSPCQELRPSFSTVMIFEPHSLLDHAVTLGIITPQVIRQAGPLRGTIALLKLLFIFCTLTLPHLDCLLDSLPFILTLCENPKKFQKLPSNSCGRDT